MPISIPRRPGTPLLRIALLLMLVAAAVFAVSAQDAAPKPVTVPKADAKDWMQLFNGRDLDGWTPKFAHHELGENFNDTFRVENGLLKVRYDKWQTFDDEFGHLFYKEPFSYYLLAAEYRFVGEQVTTARADLAWAMRNNGLMLHCRRRRRRC